MLSKKEIDKKVLEVLKTGKWMLRRSNSGESYNNFKWSNIGEWTEAVDWNPKPCCGGGLHGVGPKSSGYYSDGKDLDFCMIDGDSVDIDCEKIKCRKAMILLRNELPENLKVGGSLDLEGTQITQLPENLKVGGSLDLRGTQITQLPENLKVGGYLDLEGTQITQLPENIKVGGSLDLRGTQITQLPENIKRKVIT